MNPHSGLSHLHFTQSLEPLQGGGLGVSTVALHREWLNAGVVSRVCSTYGDSPQYGMEGVLEFRRSGPDFLFYSPELRRRARELVGSADVLHAHGFYVGTNLLLGREGRRQGRALICHVHGFFEPWSLRRSRWKKRLVHWLFEDANFRHARLWRALTGKEADQIRACGIRAPIVVVPVGLDPSAYTTAGQSDGTIDTPLAPRLAKTRPRVLFLSRLHPKKGLDLLLEAWASLAGLQRDWELIIAGPDEGGYAATIDGQILRLGLADSVRRVGKVGYDAKLGLLRSADLFVLPSRSEGFTSAILEAMAMGRPVVATRSCNFPELFAAGGGWECDATTVSVLAALGAALSASEAERQQRGQAGRRLLEERFTWKRIAAGLLDACAAHDLA